ncbi:hypothetical protein Bca52824_082916 [Brassica carinata]|uniref:Uncharacterized protein n=1 Tax=Brassica carinata TaxID=52824 RepID=A0A8X7TSD2_BRACI|nr:hypothetical protein Bca52824_082916 [Brassica carinata]
MKTPRDLHLGIHSVARSTSPLSKLKLAARIESLTSVSAVGKAVTLIRRLKILRERERSVPEPLPNLACLRSSLDLGRNLSGVKDNRCSCPIWPVVGDDGMEFDGCEKAVTAR